MKCRLRICGFNDIQIKQLKDFGLLDLSITDIVNNNVDDEKRAAHGIYNIKGVLYIGKDNFIIKKDVIECSSCGEDHINITFNEFVNDRKDYTHWGICPITNEPILMKHVD